MRVFSAASLVILPRLPRDEKLLHHQLCKYFSKFLLTGITIKIFAHLNAPTFGNFIGQLAVISSIKERILDSSLTICFSNDRPYKSSIVNCIRNADYIVGLNPPSFMPFEAINPFGSSRVRLKLDNWESSKAYLSDFIIAGNMIEENCLNHIDHIHLSPPDEVISKNKKILEGLGIDLDRWFACVYWKDPGYSYRPSNPFREIYDSSPYENAIDYIIDKLGGQVVRVGHFGSKRISPRKNLVDLTILKDSTEIQLSSIYSAKFMIGSSSGPISAACAFGTPLLVCDCLDVSGIWGKNVRVITQTIKGGSLNRDYSQFEAYQNNVLPNMYYEDNGRFFKNIPPKYTYIRNSTNQIINGIDDLFDHIKINNIVKVFTIPNKEKSIEFPLNKAVNTSLLLPFSERALQ